MNPQSSTPPLDAALASKFARLALGHLTREYPNKLDHVMGSAADAQGPRALHPIFYGSFDWHSCVHGYWLIARLVDRFPELPEALAIRALIDAHFTDTNVAAEVAYLQRLEARGFERPYGWAWLLASGGKLEVFGRPNQDSPLMEHKQPVLGVDVWEHAYYLKYQNRRPDYLAAWWNTINWQAVEQSFARARQ